MKERIRWTDHSS